ncbi:unnamed protein product [Mytilus coruscus]|uniref:Uncharacterized protein n=1 Tax=Mytilus coruscus TaxID=42192 RepID=A0A6J8DLM8_MYTCO|nr:unnamed protein product [Mytilus coruscus]
MSRSKAESIHFYKYLCQKIGSGEVVKARRLKFISEDLSYSNSVVRQISSGSKAEGLNLKSSDLDMMFLIPFYVVYESDKDAVRGWLRVALVMDTEDTQPCFTNLRLHTNYDYLPKDIQQLFQLHKGEYLLSNELYKIQMLNTFNLRMRFYEVHGPCCSDKEQKLDLAVCLKCDQWVSQAQPWISRPRLKWPSPELISKITLCDTETKAFITVKDNIMSCYNTIIIHPNRSKCDCH